MAAPALAATATATLTPLTGLDFGYVKVGTTSSAKKATLANSGPDRINVGSPSVTGPVTGQFVISADSCGGTSLAGGSSCTVSVKFTPTSTGAKTETLTVPTDATNGAQSIPLSGTGTAPGAKLSATSVSFGSWGVGVTSSSKPVKLTNTGKATLKITSISASGDFKQSNDCGSSLGAGNACTISITFRPSKLGSRTGTLTVKDDAPSGTQTASLSGTGVKLSVALDPTSLNFRIQRIHTTSFARTATLTNKGAVALLISDISASKGYSQSNSCGSSVSAGGSCSISVTFGPATEGVFQGSVTIKDNAGTQQLDLTGIGGFPAFSAKLRSLAFKNQDVGTSSLPKDVKVTNTGTDKLFITGITMKGDFSQTNTCAPYINPGITCAISVTFTPKAEKTRKGVLTINHELGVYKVSLTGTGIPAAVPSQPSTLGPTTNPPPSELGPGEPVFGRRLPGPLKLVGVLGILLLLGGGAFLLVTRRQERQEGEGQSAAPLEAGKDGIVEQPETLEALLRGIEDPHGDPYEQGDGGALGVPEASGTFGPGVEEAEAGPESDDEGNGRLPGDESLYDWASDPDSPLV